MQRYFEFRDMRFSDFIFFYIVILGDDAVPADQRPIEDAGNLSRIAWRKMEQAGLRQYLRFGAFAEQARTLLLRIRDSFQEAT